MSSKPTTLTSPGTSIPACCGFVFIQVAVDVTAQTPAGLLVDRFGSRLTLVLSGVLMTAGQLVLADTTALTQAVLARILVGLGDAMLFVAVLCLVPRWFPARRVPLITQLTTILGQLGQILSAVPFLMLLHRAGWSTAFGLAAAGSARGPARRRGRAQCSGRRMVTGVVAVRPGGRPPVAGRVGPAGYAARILRPHGYAVLDDGIRAAVGVPYRGHRLISFQIAGYEVAGQRSFTRSIQPYTVGTSQGAPATT